MRRPSREHRDGQAGTAFGSSFNPLSGFLDWLATYGGAYRQDLYFQWGGKPRLTVAGNHSRDKQLYLGFLLF